MRIILNIITTLLICALWSCTNSIKCRLIAVGEGYSETSVNGAIFRNNSIISSGNEQYIAYYDAEGYVTLGKRTLHSEYWQLNRTQYKGRVSDAHNVISIMIDGDGYLHVAFDHHGNPLNYAKSAAPYSLELGEKVPMVGINEENVTYPEFYKLRGGDILFAYRDGASGRGNLVLNRYNLQEKSWERVQNILIDGENQRNAYWQLYVDQQGTIHVSWVWRESWLVETNHDLCYARSKDNGVTWEKSNGEKYELPINAANAEYAIRIPQNSELINQTSMSADQSGNPYIATYWRDSLSNVPQYRVVWHDGNKWCNSQVSNRVTPFSLSGGGTKMIPISRPRIVIKNGEAFYIFRDIENDSKVSIAYTPNITKGNWNTCNATNFSVNAWEPSLDNELWENKGELNIFVQNVMQGDGERSIEQEPQMVYVLEIKK